MLCVCVDSWSFVLGENVRVIFEAMFAYVAVLALGLAAVLAVLYSAAWLWRSVRRGAASLPRGIKSLTIEPPPGTLNDSRDVWSMPKDD